MPKNHLREVKTGLQNPNLDELLDLAPNIASETRKMGERLKGKTVIHVNATPTGGGVAEILSSQVPLERSLGIDSHWLAMEAEPDFFVVTKKIHNLLQGDDEKLTESERLRYLEVNREIASSLSEFMSNHNRNGGILMVHDPQPLAALHCLPAKPRLHPILRLHIDLSTPDSETLSFLRSHAVGYERVIVSSEKYLPAVSWMDPDDISIIQPAIDPLSPKNRPMPTDKADRTVSGFGIDPDRPIMTQVSRFDPWKGPLGVIEAYREAKKEVRGLQLLLVGFMSAKDDPEAETVLKEITRMAGTDPDVFIFHDPAALGDLTNDEFVNAAYTSSDVIVQNSSREGFGLTMTEAMWHSKPLVAGRTAGSELQIESGKNGFLISSPAELAEKTVRLIKNPAIAKKLGNAAKESAGKQFILPMYLNSNLTAYTETLC